MAGIVEGVLLCEDAIDGGCIGAGFDTEVQGRVALGIEIHQADPATAACERCCEVHAGGRLADSALLIHHGDNAHPADPDFIRCLKGGR